MSPRRLAGSTSIGFTCTANGFPMVCTATTYSSAHCDSSTTSPVGAMRAPNSPGRSSVCGVRWPPAQGIDAGCHQLLRIAPQHGVERCAAREALVRRLDRRRLVAQAREARGNAESGGSVVGSGGSGELADLRLHAPHDVRGRARLRGKYRATGRGSAHGKIAFSLCNCTVEKRQRRWIPNEA